MDEKNLSLMILKILNECKKPEKGLPEDIFLMTSALIPIPNVDLFILNEKNEILLSWRDDIFYGSGWSLPGGCLRFYETLEERIEKTAMKELGTSVRIDKNPIMVGNAIRGKNKSLIYENIRGHNVTILYRCYLPLNFEIENKREYKENGYLKWHKRIPIDILPIHNIYNEIFKKYKLIGE